MSDQHKCGPFSLDISTGYIICCICGAEWPGAPAREPEAALAKKALEYLREHRGMSIQMMDALAECITQLEQELAAEKRLTKDWLAANGPTGWIGELRAERDSLREAGKIALIPLAALVMSGECVNAPTALTEEIKIAILRAHDVLLTALAQGKEPSAPES